MSDEDRPSRKCCPDQERRPYLATVLGHEVDDVHLHFDMLRGFIVEPCDIGTKRRLMFWHRNGRLSLKAETGYDLRRVR